MTAFHLSSAICNNNNAQKTRTKERKKNEKNKDFKWQLEINCDRIFLR